MNNTLVLLTAAFPYGSSEPFLETEITYLAQGFNRIVIITADTKNTNIRALPSNCEVLRMDIDFTVKLQLKSLLNYLNPLVKKELTTVEKVYRLQPSKSILKTMLISLERGEKTAQFIAQQHFNYATTVFYSYWCDDTALGLALLSQKQLMKAVSRIHGWDTYFERSPINYLPFRQFITEHLRQIISISQNGIDYAATHWQVDKNKFLLSRLGINGQQQLNLQKGNEFTIMSCSNIIPLKRVHLIADALHQITDYKIKWIHFGDGADMPTLKTRLTTLPGNIKATLRGRIPNVEIYAAYHAEKPHLFINVSSSEGVPVSIMEAMSFGVPCMATNVGGNGEIVTNENGCLLPSTPSADLIAQEIKRFIGMSSATYTQYSNAAFQTWNTAYNAAQNYTALVNNLKSL